MDDLPDHFEQSTLTGFTVAFGTIFFCLSPNLSLVSLEEQLQI